MNAHHTIAELHAYIDGLAANGVVARRTAGAYHMAIRSLQSTLGLGDDTDLAAADIEQLLASYLNATAGRFTRHSINTYVSNIRRAVDLFTGRAAHHVRRRRAAAATPPATLGYTIQLRPGQFVHFRLPPDLTAAEAQRLATFIITLPIEPQDPTGALDEPT
ncbi:hypothetical protein [Dactylosporangium sp. NPDC048998]|uniref:hypothetical protein n=1 Tax=Dactylosporangium sp. NPDC048998 TaxID=3363976 RepID=UPI003710B839